MTSSRLERRRRKCYPSFFAPTIVESSGSSPLLTGPGRVANHNPSQAEGASLYWAAMSGRYYSCQGNTLVGREVILAMSKAYEETKGNLADRLMAALVAGDAHGGDHRGRLAAGLVVAKRGIEGLWLELHVDQSDRAVADLATKYAELKNEAKEKK